MVNALSMITALAAIAGVQAACPKTCSVGTASGGTCTYTCTRACVNHAAGDARDSFLGALQARGYSCSGKGLTGVSCKKTANFGSCYDHYWLCGKNC
ncbi:hypothetical protein ACHAPZ_011512 [Fusarium culmorum]